MPGAAGSTDRQVDFYVVPPLAPPSQRSPEGQPGEALNGEVLEYQISKDGSLITGISRYTFNREDGRIIDELGSASFYWTRETQTQPWFVTRDRMLRAACLATDGAAVLGGESALGSNCTPDNYCGYIKGLFRWTAAMGFEPLPDDPALVTFVDSVSCSADAGAAIGLESDPVAQPRPWLWRSDLNQGKVASLAIPGLPANGDVSSVMMNDTGSAAFVDALVPGLGLGVYRWTATGLARLEPPAGYDSCGSHLALRNPDSSLLIAGCSKFEDQDSGHEDSTVRWTLATNEIVALPGAPLQPFWMNADGTALLGQVGLSVVLWRDQPDPYTLVAEGGLNAERSSLSGDTFFGELHELDDEISVFRWTEAGGLVTLQPLPGDEWSRLHGHSDEGALAVGVSHGPGGDRAVLWDELGARDVLGELVAGGADLQHVEALTAVRVWPGNPIRIQGTGYIANYFEYQQVWFAELPNRAP